MTVLPYPVPPPGRPSWVDVMDRGVELAEIIANTEFVPKGLRGNQPAILAAILYGHEVGLEPMQSLAKVAVIDGRPSLAAEAQRALILAAGHEMWVEETSVTRATVAGRRRDSKQTQRVTWTLDDAKRARIAGKQNWQTYPRQMLVARASAELARNIFADVIGGMAASEELEDADPDAGTFEPEPEAKTTTRRRRRPTAATAARETPPPAAPTTEPPPPAQEPTPAEPDPPNQAAMKKLFALFNEKGMGDRDARLAWSEQILDRQITTAKNLSAIDVSRLIETLEQLPTAEPEPYLPLPDLPANEQAILDELGDTFDASQEPPLPDEDEPPITEAQRRRLATLFRSKGISQHATWLAYCAHVLGRDVPASTAMTFDEAARVISDLEQHSNPPPGLEQETP
jgi:hypothetical protein